MNDQQLGPLLESWLKDSDARPSDVGRSMARIESLLRRTPQRGRWWPLPPAASLTGPSVGRMPARGFTMFSALKFIAAGVIVALFGGFLLAGVLTTPQEGEVPPAAVTESPSPMTTEELLSGMVIEEVEPGVFRVVDDGVRNLTPYLTHVMETESPGSFAGADGSFWIGNTPLGGEEVELPHGWGPIDFVTADGTLWAAHWSYDGERWTPHPPPVGHAEWHSRDGVVLIAWLVEPLEDEHERDIVATERSWIAARLDGEEWQLTEPITVAGTELGDTWHEFYATDDGAIWTETGSALSRWHDGEWIEDDSGVAIPSWDDHVAPDGSMWQASDPDWDWEGDPCLDMVRSYGLWEERFLTDLCPDHVEFDVGPDGAVWALAHTGPADDPQWDLYVITPAAMAAIGPPAASARTDLLPDVTLSVEEAEPGVLRVVHDGVRDVSRGLGHELIVGDDGSIWFLDDQGFLRLGYPAEPSPKWFKDTTVWAFDVARDGTVWIVDGPEGSNNKMDAVRLRSYEDGSWTTHLRRVDSIGPWTIAPDGTVWAVYPAEDGGEEFVVARLGAAGWEPLDGSSPDEVHEIFVTRNGEVWLAEVDHLWHYREDAGEWQELTLDAEGLEIDSWEARVLDDGTVWVEGTEVLLVDGEPVLDEKGRPEEGDPFVMHFDGTAWQRWGPADGVPWSSSPEERAIWNGLGLDVASIERFLSEHDFQGSAVAPDGSIWVDYGDRGLYVITPEAVAATE